MRHAHGRGFDAAIHADAGLQVAIDEPQQTGVRTATLQPRHQAVMIDPIKDGLQVHIHHPAVSCPDVRLHFAHGLMRRTPKTKSVAVAVKVRFPLRRYDLRNGLLDEAVQDRRYAQRTGFAVPFRDFHTQHRLRAITASFQLRTDFQPVVPEVVR